MRLSCTANQFPSCRWPVVGCALLLFLSQAWAAGAPAESGDAAPKPNDTTGKASPPAAWKSLFDGKTLTGWKSTDFNGRGEVKVKDAQIHLGDGYMTGITWTNVSELPRMDYEISLEAMRVQGSDFFCGLTFPVGKDPCSLIVGGWGGGVVGLSSLDGEDASQNETTKYMNFENGRWFHIRVRVTKGKIEAWIDADKVADVNTEGKTISIRLEVEASKPLGIATWNTAAALRNIKLRRL